VSSESARRPVTPLTVPLIVPEVPPSILMPLSPVLSLPGAPDDDDDDDVPDSTDITLKTPPPAQTESDHEEPEISAGAPDNEMFSMFATYLGSVFAGTDVDFDVIELNDHDVDGAAPPTQD